MKRLQGLVIFVILFMIVGGVIATRATSDPDSIGLSLIFQNGQIAPLSLVGDAPRYLQEIDIVATAETETDLGIEPIIENSDLSALDWRGIAMVEEDWRPAGDGTFIRQRFYRGARWMEKPSLFRVVPTNESGIVVGDPLIANAGKDDALNASNDDFVRRFVARQIAFGCPSEGDCAGATFVAQGLVQLRDALHAERRARTIPLQATRLELRWSAQAEKSRKVDIFHASPEEFPYGYGFKPSLEVVNAPPPPTAPIMCRVRRFGFESPSAMAVGTAFTTRGLCPLTSSSWTEMSQAVYAITTALPFSRRLTMP